ncbi:MAG TPA: PRTRC system ThiF family protein [Gemmatimonadaceae bacterium]|nr:PRTRC system ThiF family protein [Gemmatimonadaceae bacterium]
MDDLVHRLSPALVMANRPVRVAVIGCGGTGSALLGGLPFLHQALVARGREGLHVVAIDGDLVSATNCVRQPFHTGEVGLAKATVLVNRLNMFFGLTWSARASALTEDTADLPVVDVILGAVDTRAARRAIGAWVRRCGHPVYWLDCGNGRSTGQVLVGHSIGRGGGTGMLPLPDVALPELVAVDQPDDGPSCSALEALERQHPFVNQVLAFHALALLQQLFREGSLSHRGAFVNIGTSTVRPIPLAAVATPGCPRRPRRRQAPR